MAVVKVVSGGQRGADLGGLDGAKDAGIATGGWVPNGRRTESVPLSEAQMLYYNLREHSSSMYPPRTEQNILDSDGTVLFGDVSSAGSAMTIRICKRERKPFIVNPTPIELRAWCDNNNISVLNVAGNRHSVNPTIYGVARATVGEAFTGASK